MYVLCTYQDCPVYQMNVYQTHWNQNNFINLLPKLLLFTHVIENIIKVMYDKLNLFLPNYVTLNETVRALNKRKKTQNPKSQHKVKILSKAYYYQISHYHERSLKKSLFCNSIASSSYSLLILIFWYIFRWNSSFTKH